MKLIVLVLCIFTVCYGATSKLKAHQDYGLFSEEEVVINIPGSSYQLNTIAEEEPLPTSEPTEAAVVYTAEPELPAEPPVEEILTVEEPPVEQPPVEQPPVEQPPIEQPPYIEGPPVELPPVEQPPVEQPPIEQPPYIEGPPVEQPPIEQPPYIEGPPVELPPVDYAQPDNTEVTYGVPVENAEVYYTTAVIPEEQVWVVEEPIYEAYEQPIETVGGYTDVDISRFDQDQDLQAAARVCIDALLGAARRDRKLTTNADFAIRAINRIQSQVVAGTNYAFDVVLGTDADADARIYATFTAFSQPWTNTLACTEGCVKVGRMVRV